MGIEKDMWLIMWTRLSWMRFLQFKEPWKLASYHLQNPLHECSSVYMWLIKISMWKLEIFNMKWKNDENHKIFLRN